LRNESHIVTKIKNLISNSVCQKLFFYHFLFFVNFTYISLQQRRNVTEYTKLRLDDDGEDGDDDKEGLEEVKISYDEDPFPEQLILWFVGEFSKVNSLLDIFIDC
jgi:hypothetical protein